MGTRKGHETLKLKRQGNNVTGGSGIKSGRERKVILGKGIAFAKAWRWDFTGMKLRANAVLNRFSPGTTNPALPFKAL